MSGAGSSTKNTGNVLPYPEPPFEGEVKVNASESTQSYPAATKAPENAPNIILIMTDDVGFGAASAFGGPCHTDTMEQLLEEGIRYNRFHTTALCSPTRAALLTGREPHNCAQGIIAERCMGFPGYNFLMPKSCGTVAEILKQNGYNTAWFGKNHNVPEWQMSQSGPFDLWPTNLGFEYFYGFIGGDCNQWKPNLYRNTTPIQPYEGKDDYHLDADLADEAIQWIRQHQALTPSDPFFVYYVPGATHAPHHVPDSYIEKYKGKFDNGWHALREETFEKQIAKNIIPDTTKNTPYPSNMPEWEPLSDDRKRVYSHMMEVYAGFLEYTDHNIGRVLKEVKEQGIEDNTLVIYIQGDNGGSAEGTVQGTTNELAVLGNDIDESFSFIQEQSDNGLLGGPMNYNHFPVSWSWALNCPMQWTKRYASHFGGTRNGMVMKWPNKITDVGTSRSQFHHVVDIAPTILTAAGVPWPLDSINGVTQKPLDGISMTYTWEAGCAEERRVEQIFEMFGNRGLYQEGYMCCTTPLVFAWDDDSQNGTYKASDFEWELYDLNTDFSQGHNLAKDDPLRTEKMRAAWMEKARNSPILPLVFTENETIMAGFVRPNLNEGRRGTQREEHVVLPDGVRGVQGCKHGGGDHHAGRSLRRVGARGAGQRARVGVQAVADDGP
ncbi:arylsulfatase [Gracilaria domingensis]|nr:arylsulfatase [Gracilaria domingensis]